MAKIEKRVQVLTEGINANVSDALMADGEVIHSTNTDSNKIGMLTKCAGQSQWWDVGSASVTALAQLGADSYAIMNGALYKKGTEAAVVSSLLAASPLVAANGQLFYIKSDNTLGAYTGSATSVINLNNSPTGISDLLYAGGKLYAVNGTTKICYVSTTKRRLVGTVVSDHIAGVTTINVSSTRFIRVGNVLEFWPIGATAAKQVLTVLTVPSATTFTCAALAINGAPSMTTGSGQNDLLITTTAYTPTVRKYYEIKVIVGGATSPNTFQWRVNGGSWSTTTNMSASDVTIGADGVKVKWTSITGHTADNIWGWYQTPGTLTSGDEIYYTGQVADKVLMWNDDANLGSWFDVDSESGAYTGSAEQLGTAIFVFPNEVKRFNGTDMPSIAMMGTTVKNTIARVGRKVFFANSHGIYMTDGNTVSRISQKMDPYFDGIQDYSVMCAGSDDNLYRLYIGGTTYKDLTTTNVTGVEIVLDTSSMKFEIRTGVSAKTYGELVVSNAHTCYLGDAAGNVMKIGDGTSNFGTDIPFMIQTRHDDLDKPNDRKQGDRVVFKSEPGSVMDVYYALDRGDYKPLGQITEVHQAFSISDLRFYTISFQVSENSSDTPPGLYEYTVFAYDESPIVSEK